jgi:signal transduction histidine kinase
MTDRPDASAPRQVSPRVASTLVLGGVGVVTFGIHLRHLLGELDEVVAVAVGVVPPMVISGLLVAGGCWLWQCSIAEEYHARILLWVGASTVGLGGLGASVAVYQWAHGTPQTDVPFMVVNWLATGAFGGFLVGVYDARKRALADELRREREEVAARERELSREVERLERFAGIVSHDLRNPLTVAAGRLDLARDARESEHLAAAADALDRMDAIIDDVLTMARDGRDVPETEREPTSLADCAAECWENVVTADATLVVEGDLVVEADRSRLHALFENLYRNAVEHGGEDVAIRVGPLDAGAGFYVEDDGPGLPDQADLFDPGVTTADDGTGLGLAIVREVVSGHDWEVRAVDGTDGGARFEIAGVEGARALRPRVATLRS